MLGVDVVATIGEMNGMFTSGFEIGNDFCWCHLFKNLKRTWYEYFIDSRFGLVGGLYDEVFHEPLGLGGKMFKFLQACKNSMPSWIESG